MTDTFKLGNYLIHRQLGEGGMGKIFAASHALMGRPAAIKVIQPDGPDPHTVVARFEREVRLCSSLTHPNTVTIFDFGRDAAGTFYYAMELLEGLDLQRLVEKFGPVSAARTSYVLLQVCGSLGEAHSKNIIHRDIKPSNIFLTQRGNIYDFVKVLDFGLAKNILEDSETFLTPARAFFGTPLYFAPESVQGMSAMDARSDVYNLGGVAYWMLTGHPPFQSDSKMQLIVEHISKQPLPPSQLTELFIPEELDRVVLKCLEKKPEDRFATVQELEAALRAIRFEEGWNGETARAWWNLHRPVEINATESLG